MKLAASEALDQTGAWDLSTFSGVLSFFADATFCCVDPGGVFATHLGQTNKDLESKECQSISQLP
jgi:hypothetical protein